MSMPAGYYSSFQCFWMYWSYLSLLSLFETTLRTNALVLQASVCMSVIAAERESYAFSCIFWAMHFFVLCEPNDLYDVRFC